MYYRLVYMCYKKVLEVREIPLEEKEQEEILKRKAYRKAGFSGFDSRTV